MDKRKILQDKLYDYLLRVNERLPPDYRVETKGLSRIDFAKAILQKAESLNADSSYAEYGVTNSQYLIEGMIDISQLRAICEFVIEWEQLN